MLPAGLADLADLAAGGAGSAGGRGTAWARGLGGVPGWGVCGTGCGCPGTR